MRPGTAKKLEAIINGALRGELDETHARQLHGLGPEAVALAMLAVSKYIAEQSKVIAERGEVIAGLQRHHEDQAPTPSMPSGMVPVYHKPNTPKRCKKPGARNGHPGHGRKAPARGSKQLV